MIKLTSRHHRQDENIGRYWIKPTNIIFYLQTFRLFILKIPKYTIYRNLDISQFFNGSQIETLQFELFDQKLVT